MTFWVLFVFPVVVGEVLWLGMYLLTTFLNMRKAARTGTEWNGRSHRISYLFLGIVGPVVYCFLMYTLAQSMADSRYTSYNSTAKTLYRLAESYLEDCDDYGRELPGTVLANAGDTAEENSFPAYVQENLSGLTGWYAMVCDEEGALLYTLYSPHALGDADIHPYPERSKEECLHEYLFGEGMIGYYGGE